MTRDGACTHGASGERSSGAGGPCSSGHQSRVEWLPGNMSYLETSFWNDDTEHESDDEGIGSDNSVDHVSDSGHGHQKTPVKQSLSVTKFLRVLKASVRRDPRLDRDHDSHETGAVFGLDLYQHLSTTSDTVPNVVRWEQYLGVSVEPVIKLPISFL